MLLLIDVGCCGYLFFDSVLTLLTFMTGPQEGSFDDVQNLFARRAGKAATESGGAESIGRTVRGEAPTDDGKAFAEEHAKLFDDVDPLKYLSQDPRQQVYDPPCESVSLSAINTSLSSSELRVSTFLTSRGSLIIASLDSGGSLIWAHKHLHAVVYVAGD